MPTFSSGKRGKYIRATIPKGRTNDVALEATIKAATVSRPRGELLPIRESDLRQKVRIGRASCLYVFVVDASGSMGANRRMAAAKGAVMSLLKRAYEKRDRVAMIAFRRDSAEVVLPPTRSIDRAAKCLQDVPTGGKTPLPAGIWKGIKTVRTELAKNDSIIPVLVLITDGRGNVPMNEDVFAELDMCASEIEKRRVRAVVVDAEHGRPRLGLAAKFARKARAAHCLLDKLTPDHISQIARQRAIS